MKGFVGREYVFDAIEAFMSRELKGYFSIIGFPGVGKTSILAEYARRNASPAYFNVAAQGRNAAQGFLRSICTQIIQRYGLSSLPVPEDAWSNGDFLESCLKEAARSLPDRTRLVVVVDALDEIDISQQRSGTNALFLPPVLPERVYFLLSKRYVDLPLRISEPQDVFDLKDYANETVRDLSQYICRSLEDATVRTWVARQGTSSDEFVSILCQKSEGNFMYLRYVLADIREGLYSNITISRLPAGLESYYEDHWRRMGMRGVPQVDRVKVVYVLAAADCPISTQFLAKCMGRDEFTVQVIVDEWGQFLLHQYTSCEKRHSIYHTSFRDFLYRKDIVQAAGISLREISSLLANATLNEIVKG